MLLEKINRDYIEAKKEKGYIERECIESSQV